MATIIYNSEDIADAYAPSLNAAFEDLYNASGVKPRVIAPYGAWSSRAIDAAYGIKGRGPASDHYKGRAVDIYNWSTIAARIGLSPMQQILAAHGWLNVQVNGDAFPTEPWHYANQSAHPTAAAVSVSQSTPDPLVPIEEENTMNGCIYYVARDANGAEANERTAKLTTATGHVVEPYSMYFQERPGAGIVAFSGGKKYDSDVVSRLEYTGFAAARKPWNDDASDARVIVKNTDMVALINKRGLVA